MYFYFPDQMVPHDFAFINFGLKLDYLGAYFPWESNACCHENKAQLVCFKHSFELI